MTEATPKIRIRGLKKAFGPKVVLDGVDLDVMGGTSFVVIGGSGTGKSVLLRCILGLITPDAGSIEIDGVDVTTLSPRQREPYMARIGMLFQNGALFDSLSVWENVTFGLMAAARIGRGPRITRAQARARAARCWNRWAWTRRWARFPLPNSRAACRSAWGWRAPSRPSLKSCSLMNRPRVSTRSWGL